MPSSVALDNNGRLDGPGAAESYAVRSDAARRTSRGYEELPSAERLSTKTFQPPEHDKSEKLGASPRSDAQKVVDEAVEFCRYCMQLLKMVQEELDKIEQSERGQGATQLAEQLKCSFKELEAAEQRFLRTKEISPRGQLALQEKGTSPAALGVDLSSPGKRGRDSCGKGLEMGEGGSRGRLKGELRASFVHLGLRCGAVHGAWSPPQLGTRKSLSMTDTMDDTMTLQNLTSLAVYNQPQPTRAFSIGVGIRSPKRSMSISQVSTPGRVAR